MVQEVWQNVKEYEGLYQISNIGRIKSTLSGDIILKQSNRGNGYLCVCLYKRGVRKMCSVHRLVAESFLEECAGKKHVNHKDGDKQNNHAGNLEFCTQKENINYNFKVLNHKGPRLGCKASKSTLEKMSAANKGKLLSVETKRKMSLSRSGSNNWKSKKIICVEREKIYDTITNASKDLNVSAGNIASVCRKERKTAGGYHWDYAD